MGRGETMYTGYFLQKFFEERGDFEVKSNDEADVLCPFKHDSGNYEKNPSAHVNVERGVFHCKTCRAEGRFSDGGLSEISFVKEYYSMSYEDAVRMLSDLYKADHLTLESWNQYELALYGNEEHMDFLRTKRGLTEETIKEYHLATRSVGIDLPVLIYGEILDVRSYNRQWKEESEQQGRKVPKIKSNKGAKPLLFPFDDWRLDERPTILMGGEFDALITRQNGFNAVTGTMGEGVLPKMFIGMFKDKEVYVCYDCDAAGKQAAKKVAFQLVEAGALVKIVDLGLILTGEKDDKDTTDFFVKRGLTADDFQNILNQAKPFSDEELQEIKNEHYPLVPLWDMDKGEYVGKRISSRVIMMGSFTTTKGATLETPTAVEWKCKGYDPENKLCAACGKGGKSGWWTLEDNNLDELLELVDCTTAKQSKALQQFIGIPEKCPGHKKTIRAKKPVQQVIFSPDTESESELSGYRQSEQVAYVIDQKLEVGHRYRAYYRRYAHPKDQSVVMIVDKSETSDNAVNTFKMTPEVMNELSQFQGDPWTVMKKRHENTQRLIGKYAPELVSYAVDIVYHSVLDFVYGDRVIKGHPEGLVVGESRTGKSDTAKSLMEYYRCGSYTECKTATVPGLVGTADKMPNGAWRVKWGKIPRNHGGLLILDELSGLPKEAIKTLTVVRSERKAILTKAASGEVPAKTRMLWISNPQTLASGNSLGIDDYPNGVKIVTDLVGSDEDIARFDFIVILPPNNNYISPLTKEKLDAENNPAYRNLIYWAWTRKPEQIKFDSKVDEYIWQRSMEMNEKYDTKVKIFGSEAYKKIAKIAVSVAGCCFSHADNGESILVKKEHVDWACEFMVRCYDNNTFRLAEYVAQTRLTTETNDDINELVAGMIEREPLFMQTLNNGTEISMFYLRTVAGMDNDQFKGFFSNLVMHHLVQTSGGDKIMPTKRLRKAFEAYRDTYKDMKMRSLTEGDQPLL